MTNTNDNNDIQAILRELAISQLQTQQEIQELTSDVNRVLSRSAIYDDVVMELRETQQLMQANFNEHQRTLEEYRRDFLENQRTSNAALNSLEAINLRLIEIITREQQ
jgi:ElaB/YqjD/DUF883 family membrane-anchored ribosome-binding protein